MDNGELADLGLRAFHAQDYAAAITYLSDYTRRDARQWQCRLYLAMAYCGANKIPEAVKEFRTISEICPDSQMREKALSAMRALNAKSQTQLQTLQSRKRTAQTTH